jgi:acyl-CoA oxidase
MSYENNSNSLLYSTGRVGLVSNQLKAKELKNYTMEEVTKHNKEGDCWVVLFGNVYDVSKFKFDHPGGKDSIMLYAGQDATEQFDLMHQDSVLKKYGPELQIGKLVGTKTLNKSEKPDRNERAKNVPALLKLTPGNVQSRTCGGTSHILPEERKKTSFNVEELMEFIQGGKENVKRRKFIESTVNKDPGYIHKLYNFNRAEYLAHGVEEFIRIHKPYKTFVPTREDICIMSEMAGGTGALSNSHSIFMATVVGQGNEEQIRYWVPKILNFEITGSYAQTELGHGSNVRGLQTIAEYDKNTEEFVLNTPTLQSIKWWPGCLGKIATHCVLYAQLLVDGKEYGVQVFMLQIRDENHKPLSGIRLGDLGNKMGDGANDTGFMWLDNVRIPRENMLMKYRKVTKDGRFEDVIKADAKVHYTTMMTTRACMVSTAAVRLCQAVTIAIRYSCVRQQGFVDSTTKSYKSPEVKIIDYKIQQYRLFKQLATGYALRCTGRWMIEQLAVLEGKQVGIIKNTELLKEIAATSAGLKSLCTIVATNGIEDCRKCCGGNGYLLNSGIAAMGVDYLWQVTAEGDASILALLTGKHLLKSIGKIFGGTKLQGIMDYLNVISEPEFDLARIKPSPAKTASDYLNLNYLFNIFKYRSIERNLSVAKDFNESVSQGLTFEQAFFENSNEILKATHSHCYYIIIHNFVNKIKEMKNPAISKVLTRLCILYSCCNFLDENWGDVINEDQYRLIRETAYNMMKEIRPDCVGLVDAFDFKDIVLRSDIGRYDGNVYEALFDSAQKSILNQTDPFEGYEEYLKPHTNKELLKRGNKPVLSGKF